MKSYTKKELIDAQKTGQKLWKLDTVNSGEDDILIGEQEDIIEDICHYHEIDFLPENWTLTKIDYPVEDEF